ncbi:hypothetical protein HQ576_16550, partial [bacterium]|nr:hypothetical protein [bacterium]
MRCVAALLSMFACFASAGAAPVATERGGTLAVEGAAYRLEFQADGQMVLELRDGKRQWRRVTRRDKSLEFALAEGGAIHSSAHAAPRRRHVVADGVVTVGVTMLLSPAPRVVARVHFLCVDEGVLVRFALEGDAPPEAMCWPMPRLWLPEPLFDAYTYWRAPDAARQGRLEALGDQNVYAGVSAWGDRGDTAKRLSSRHPALVVRGESAGLALGVVLVDYGAAWKGSFAFIQRHRPSALFLYAAQAPPEAAARGLWAWLAPFPPRDTVAAAQQVERLLAAAARLAGAFRAIAPEPDAEWGRRLPDFPPSLRRAKPVADIRDAVVYTVNEYIHSDHGLALARKVGSDVLVRGWFKWHEAPDWASFASLVPKAHALGALFGGGITCSALYDGENGLAEKAWRDLATRGPDGKLVDAWGEAGTRHGTLSNPAYLRYLLRWCTQQIDAGADYLFMDEHTAALQANEGFDDHSCRDFRDFLRQRYVQDKGWRLDDPRWQQTFGIALADKAECPDGTLASFAYRAYLARRGFVAKPHDGRNPLAREWHASRRWRDDRAWKWLTDAIRAYARSRGRRVLLSANGLARYVDLQVLGVWGEWRVKDGRVDLRDNQIHAWGSTVGTGWALAGRRVPVVFFHDWGFGGFPWLKVPSEDRRLWMRVRGAEIYAAGGFFAFPVHGPFGQDALRDGTLAEVARQTAYYQRHRRLYLDARPIGFEP